MILNKAKKFVIINLVLIFIMSVSGLSQISFADVKETKKQSNVNVTNIEKGVKVGLYKIASLEFDEELNLPKDKYNWVDEVKEWVNKNIPEYSKTEEVYKKIESNSNEANELYDKIISAVRKDEISMNPYMEEVSEGEKEYPVTEEKLTGNVKFTNVDMGTYIVLIENGYMVYTPSIVNVIPKFDLEQKVWNLEDEKVIIKASKPNITKSVTRLNNTKDNFSTKDNIYYTIKSDVPSYLENSLSKKYVIRDEMDKSLELNENSILILGLRDTGMNVSESLDKYKLNITEISDKRILEIEFDYNDIKQFKTITVEYMSKLAKNETLITNENGNNNTAYLEYSNNPYKSESTQTQISEKVTVFSYDMEIKFVDKENQTQQLDKSKFNIIDSMGEKIYFIKGSDNNYYVSEVDTDGALADIEVNDIGEAKIKGLDEGEYKIKQIKAKDGYLLQSKPYNISLKDSNLDGRIDDTNVFKILNTKGYTLPLTGGKGTKVLIASGIALIGIGVILSISIYKKRKILENK